MNTDTDMRQRLSHIFALRFYRGETHFSDAKEEFLISIQDWDIFGNDIPITSVVKTIKSITNDEVLDSYLKLRVKIKLSED